MISDKVLSQSYIELMQWFIWALLQFALMFYAHKASPSCFLSLCKIVWVLRGLPATLALRVCVVPAHLFSLCYDCIFAFKYLGWIGMLCSKTS